MIPVILFFFLKTVTFANLLSNPSFESPSVSIYSYIPTAIPNITDWHVGAPYIPGLGGIVLVPSSDSAWGGGIPPYSSQYVGIQGLSNNISQTVVIPTTQNYYFSFFHRCRPGYSPIILYVLVNSETILTIPLSNSSWIRYGVVFSASPPTIVLKLLNQDTCASKDGDCTNEIDDLSLVILEPTATPSQQPTAYPSTHPSIAPSNVPTLLPSSAPSPHPTIKPSASPTQLPSAAQSTRPSVAPSAEPSFPRTRPPSDLPTIAPSSAPYFSSYPITASTLHPSVAPTNFLSSSPSVLPTSLFPLTVSSSDPSFSPTVEPPQSISPPQSSTLRPSYFSTVPSRGLSLSPLFTSSVNPTKSLHQAVTTGDTDSDFSVLYIATIAVISFCMLLLVLLVFTLRNRRKNKSVEDLTLKEWVAQDRGGSVNVLRQSWNHWEVHTSQHDSMQLQKQLSSSNPLSSREAVARALRSSDGSVSVVNVSDSRNILAPPDSYGLHLANVPHLDVGVSVGNEVSI